VSTVELDQPDLGGKTVSGLSWQMFASVVSFVARFGLGIVLARLLPPEDFGIVGVALIVTGFATTLTELGLGPALIQRKEISERHIRVCVTISASLAIVTCLVLYGSAGAIASFFRDARVAPVLQVLSLSFVLSGFGITGRALLTRRLAFRESVLIQMVASILGYGGVAVVMAALGYGYWSLVGGTLAQALLSTVLTYGAARHSLRPLVDRAAIRDLAGFSAGMSLTSVVNYFARQGDYFVVGRLTSAASLGLYTRAYTLMTLPLTFIGSALSQVLFPSAARIQHDQDRFRRAYLTAFGLSVAVSLPISLGVSVLAPEVILIIYGQPWAPAIPLLQILALFGMFRMSYNTAAAFVRARGQAYRLLFSQLVYATLVVGGSWWIIPRAGLMGVSWVVGGAITSMWLLVVVFANRSAGVRIGEFVQVLASSAGPPVLLAGAFYGLVMANVFCLPAANKLKSIIHGQVKFREMMIEGIISIAEGENPRNIEAKLQGYLH